MPATTRLFLHVGMPKTGTTYLQSVVFGNREVLARQGLGLVPHRRRGHFALVLATQGRARTSDGPIVTQAPQRWARQVRALEHPVGLFTHETMGSSTPAQIARLLEPLGDHEVHVVLTVRDLARQLSSSWQQQVKTRGTTTFDDFVEGVVHGGASAPGFWIARDLPALLERWGAAAPPERTHVVVSPPPGRPPTLLLERFCQVLEIDPGGLDTRSPRDNPTLGHAQAELLRRVNVALGDRLPDPREGYGAVARRWLAETVLLGQGGERPLVPASVRPWIEERTQEWIDVLRGGGYDVVGDLEELRALDGFFHAPGVTTEPSEDAVLAAAARALADVLEVRDVEQRAAAEVVAQDVPQPAARSWLGRLRRRLSRGNAEVGTGR